MTSVEEIGGLTAEAEAWAVGSAVVASGVGEDGVEGVAVWHVSNGGRPTGAWFEPHERAFGDRETARVLLTLVERRALVTEQSRQLDEIVGRLTAAAAADAKAGWWAPHVVSATGAFADVVRRRSDIEQVVADVRAAGRSVARVDWNRDLAGVEEPRTVDELRSIARLAPPEGAPVVSEVLASARVLHWLVAVWKETEQVKNRRSYVLDALGPAEPLPPAWRTAVATANTNRLPL